MVLGDPEAVDRSATDAPECVPLEVQVVEDYRIEDTTVRPHSALTRPTTPRPEPPTTRTLRTGGPTTGCPIHADAPINHQAKRSLRRRRITPPRGRDVVSDRCAAERATMGRPAKP